jgi:hypothetical protein
MQVGIIGFITTSTANNSNPDDTLTFLDEITSVTEEAARLKVWSTHFWTSLDKYLQHSIYY